MLRDRRREGGAGVELHAAAVVAAAVQQLAVQAQVVQRLVADKAARLQGDAGLLHGIVASLAFDAVVDYRSVAQIGVAGELPAQRARFEKHAVAPLYRCAGQHDQAHFGASLGALHQGRGSAQVHIRRALRHESGVRLRQRRTGDSQ